MAEQPKRDPVGLGRHLDKVARRALAPKPTAEPDSVTQLENVAIEAWHNLIGPDGFLPVLLLLFLAMISAPLLGEYEVGVIITIVISASALLLTVFRSTHRRGFRWGAVIYVAIASAGSAAALLAKTTGTIEFRHLAIVVMSLNLVVLLTAFPLVLLRSFQHRRVTVNTACATLAAYLLIGLIFTTIYRLSGQIAPPFFSQFEGGGAPTPGEYTYFSFMTLTTVGYGDFTAASDPGRAFVMVEAVLGQIFLVTMLARVIGMLGVQRAMPEAVRGVGTETPSDDHHGAAVPAGADAPDDPTSG